MTGWPEGWGLPPSEWPENKAAGDAEEGNERDSWSPVDLGPYLRGGIPKVEPTVGLARSDGLRCFYPGKEHSVIGEMEAGKSWFLLASAAAELNAGNTVVYIHFEEADPSDSAERLLALGVSVDVILRRLLWVAPERQVSAEAVAALLALSPTLVVLDGVNEAMALHGWGVREEDGAAAFRRHLVKPFTRAGAAVVSADHVVKDRERRDRGPLGSIHKGNGLSGSLILLENVEPFGRTRRGRSTVYVTKDRPGYLRQHGRETKLPGKTLLGTLVVDDTRERVAYLDLVWLAPAPTAADLPLDEDEAVESCAAETANPQDRLILSEVEKIAAAGHVADVTTIRAHVHLRNTVVAEALARLVVAGDLEMVTAGRQRSYRPTHNPQDRSGVGIPDAA